LLGSADMDMQILAVRALGRIGGDQALEPVRRLYNAPHSAEKKPLAPAARANAAPGAEPQPCLVPPALAVEMREVLKADQAPLTSRHAARKSATHD
jgi:hypothetical protein